MTSIKDIAQACGVSPATVSHVLNNHHGEVGEETRMRVLQAIRQMNYRPGKGNRTPRGSVLTIGVCGNVSDQLTLDKTYSHFRTVVVALSAVIDSAGHHTLLFSSREFHRDPIRSIHSYCDGRCEGLVVLAPNIDTVLGSSLRERGFPHVIIGDEGSETSDACYSVDNMASARMAVDELIKHGHRRIAFCTGPESFISLQGRREGYRQALHAADIPIDPALIAPSLAAPEAAFPWARDILREPAKVRPTAIFCFNDLYARAVLRAAVELNIQVPRDLSLIGFDDADAGPNELLLTTIRQPFPTICEKALEELSAMIHGETIDPGRRVFRGELIRRQSVANAPKAN